MRTLKYEGALQELISAAEQFGVDQVVPEPIRFLERGMNLSYHSSLACLRELERRGLITLDREGVGAPITRARIKKKEAPERFHEVSARQRLLSALWKNRRPSQQNPGKDIVHSLAFAQVHGEADILQPTFYAFLEEFEKNDWLRYTREPSGRILFVVLTDKFPTP